jgi:hypothetical protein
MVQGDHMQRSIYFHYMWSLWQTEQRTWKEQNLHRVVTFLTEM